MERTDLAERWTALFAEYDAGEGTRRAFCEARGLKLSTFDTGADDCETRRASRRR